MAAKDRPMVKQSDERELDVPCWINALLAILAIVVCLSLGGRFVVFGQLESKDEKVLETYFKIEHKGDEIVMEPLLCPSFKLILMEGDGKEANTITKCGVFKRKVSEDDEKGIVTFITVLKCGNNTYGLSEVDFQKDNPN